jgi:hypothetical protein
VMKVDSIFQLPSHSWLDMGLNVSEFLPDHRWPNENDLHEFELDVSSCPTHRWNMSLMGSPSHGSFHCHSEGRTFFFFFFFLPEHKVSRLPAEGGNAFTHGRVSSNSVGLWPLGLLPTKTSPEL